MVNKTGFLYTRSIAQRYQLAKSFYLDRLNLLGCQYCLGALGMENRAISNSQISASSQWDANHAANQARLFYQAAGNKQGAWSARANDANQWLQVQLPGIFKITYVATQGRNGADQWVTKYMFQHSDDGVRYQYYSEHQGSKNKVRIHNFIKQWRHCCLFYGDLER